MFVNALAVIIKLSATLIWEICYFSCFYSDIVGNDEDVFSKEESTNKKINALYDPKQHGLRTVNKLWVSPALIHESLMSILVISKEPPDSKHPFSDVVFSDPKLHCNKDYDQLCRVLFIKKLGCYSVKYHQHQRDQLYYKLHNQGWFVLIGLQIQWLTFNFLLSNKITWNYGIIKFFLELNPFPPFSSSLFFHLLVTRILFFLFSIIYYFLNFKFSL